MITAETFEKAKQAGREEAKAVIAFRNEELKKRTKAVAKAQKAKRLKAPVKLTKEMLSALGPPSEELLIAEGDSWFDYPLHDVLRILEDHYGYDVESVAHRGDRVEDMAYAEGQLEEFCRLVEKALRRGSTPKAILLSGGGNDVAGDEFGMLLNHASSGIAGLNESIVKGVIDERAKLAYVTIISKITEVCKYYIPNGAVPILIHGYDYPVPDGRGFLGGWWFLPGPWLEPGFREKGFYELPKRISIAKDLMDRFNEMIKTLPSTPDFSHVHYINLRNTLSTAQNYKDDWANELHPTKDGFVKVTARFAEVLETLP
jgi:lysophospholipase L1-like esterase